MARAVARPYDRRAGRECHGSLPGKRNWARATTAAARVRATALSLRDLRRSRAARRGLAVRFPRAELRLVRETVLPSRAALPAAARPAVRRSRPRKVAPVRSEEHTSELQSLMRISYAVFCLKKKKKQTT